MWQQISFWWDTAIAASLFLFLSLWHFLAIYSISPFLSAPYCASLVCFPAYLQSVNTSSLVLLAIDLVSPLQSSQCTHANPAFDTTPPRPHVHTLALLTWYSSTWRTGSLAWINWEFSTPISNVAGMIHCCQSRRRQRQLLSLQSNDSHSAFSEVLP